MAVITLKQLLHRPAPGGPISPSDPLPARLFGGSGDPVSLPTLAKQQEILDAVALLATEEKLELVRALIETLEGKAATETTLAAVLAKLSDDPATMSGQTSITNAITTLAGVAATETTLATAVTRLESILSRLESTLDIADRAERKLGEVTFPTPQEVTLTGSVVYDEDTTSRSINAGASLVVGVYEFPATHRKYSVAYRGVNIGDSLVVEVLWGQSDSTFNPDSTGNVFAFERPTLHKRSEYQIGGTDYERWTDAQLPARARYAQIRMRNTHETNSITVRRTLVMLEPTFGV